MDRNPVGAGSLITLGGVALRKESVDRNQIDRSQLWVDWRSLSARRAWIEIFVIGFIAKNANCRSPQGERG